MFLFLALKGEGGSRAQSLLMYQTKGKDVAKAETFLNKLKQNLTLVWIMKQAKQ